MRVDRRWRPRGQRPFCLLAHGDQLGNYTGQGDKLEVKDLKGRIGESEISGQASLVGTERKRVDVELASPHLDLTPFLAQGTDAKAAGDAPAKPKAQPKQAKGEVRPERHAAVPGQAGDQGGKGVVSGAAAAATGGVSVVAQGLMDRAKGVQDLCKETLEEVAVAGKAK